MKRAPRWLQWLLASAILLLAAVALRRQLQQLSLAELRAAWAGTSALTIALSLSATAVSFACLAGYERFATQRAVPGRIPAAVALRVGAMSHAISNTLGFHALTGGALRYRLYRNRGLGVADVARVVAWVAVCVGAGVVLVSAIALLRVQLAAGASAAVAITALSLLGLVTLARARRGRWAWLAAADGNAGGMLLLATVEMTAAIGALYVLLPAGVAPPLASFVLVFVGAMLLGIASHSPGGIGVFEATMLTAMPAAQAPHVLVALLLYRAIYNLLPFAVAVAALSLAPLRRDANAPAGSV